MSQQQDIKNQFLPQEQAQVNQQQGLILHGDPQDQMIELGDLGGSLNYKFDGFNNYSSYEANGNLFNENQIDLNNSQNLQNKNLSFNRNNSNNQLNGTMYRSVNYSANGNDNYYPNQQQQKKQQNLTKRANQIARKCICKKTQCLKMYCQCFANGIPCNQQCICLECKNTSQHQNQIYQAKLLIRQKGIVGLHSCSLSQKRCNCKKSNCLKKYCQCFNSGVRCSQGCKCIQCKNCDDPFKNDDDENQKGQNKQQIKQQNKKQRKPKQKKQKTQKVA